MSFKQPFKLYTTLLALVTTLVASGTFPLLVSGAGPATQSTSPMLDFGTLMPIAGTWSKLVRTDSGISIDIHTSELVPGDTYTVWWIIFNYPDECSGACGEDDLLLFGGPEAVKGTVVYATGHVAGDDGTEDFGAHLSAGDTSGVLLVGPGLLEPRTAEVHLVVRSHGPKQAGLVNEQIGTFGGGCNNAPPGTGEPGNFACYDPQATVHIP